ncbi:MAG: APC family permease [Actinomycetota bacterium]|nr:APC family permease [Actinomycetota bacterium]
MSSVSGGEAPASAVFGDTGHLQRTVGLRGLTLISLGSIIGSGWLLGALNAATAAGPASLLSWILAGGILATLALVHAELGAAYPISGGTARFPFISFGAIGGFTGGWMAWIQAVTIAPIEVEAALTYFEGTSVHPGFVAANGTLTFPWGYLVAAVLIAVFTYINIMGVRWLAESNNITMIWKVLVPVITIVVLIIVSFDGSNFSAGGGFAPFGAHGIFAALPLGVVFALQGFEQAIQVGGEAKDPQRDIHRAVIISMIIGTIMYILLEVAFIGAISPKDVAKNWNNPIPGVGSFGPYASLATAAGVTWLASILYVDAVVSPSGTGLVYAGTSARLSYALGRNGYVPPALGRVDKRGVPFVSLIFCWVIGMLVLLPFPSWAGMVGLVTSATVLMYAMAPVSLAVLRQRDPDRPRPYRLPVAKVLAPLSFVCANFVVYWSGWNTIFWLYVMIIIGYVVFFVYQAVAPPNRKLHLDWRPAAWVLPWLVGLGLIAYLGQFPASKPSSGWPFDVALLAQQTIPFWWDLVVVGVFSLVVFYMAVHFAQPKELIQQAIAAAQDELSLDAIGEAPAATGATA